MPPGSIESSQRAGCVACRAELTGGILDMIDCKGVGRPEAACERGLPIDLRGQTAPLKLDPQRGRQVMPMIMKKGGDCVLRSRRWSLSHRREELAPFGMIA